MPGSVRSGRRVHPSPERGEYLVHRLDDLRRRSEVHVEGKDLPRPARDVLFHLYPDTVEQSVVRLAETVYGLLFVAHHEQGWRHALVRALSREDLLGELVQDGPLDVARVLELVHQEVEYLAIEPVEDIRRLLALEQAIGIDLKVVKVQEAFPEL